jgi:hypothetical protein
MAKDKMPEKAKDPRIRERLGVDEPPPEFPPRERGRVVPGPQGEAGVDDAGLVIPGPRTTDEGTSGCPGYV